MVYVLPGIEGPSRINRNIVRGLLDGGIEGAVEIFDWSTTAGPFGWYVHLTDIRRHRVEAFRLARRIVRYQRAYPDRPIFLVAHSGGAGIALSAVEILPETAGVDGVILLAAAVSPQRDLSRALTQTRRGIWNFHSLRDFGFLVVGTTLFGTIDRQHRPSAGALGFDLPENADDDRRALYTEKLHEVPYAKEMSHDGNLGTHNGWTRRTFVANWIAPIILDQPSPVTP